MLLCAVEQDIDTGYQFGILAYKLLEKFNSKDQKAKIIQLVSILIAHWKDHISHTIPKLREAYKIGL